MPTRYWLMKAEPDSRVVKGKDVKFSVDDFESIGTTPWEGVRNHEAKNLMKDMKNGDKVLFYHSNCKTPGIAAFAEVSKEAYFDYTAWDPDHPYYDAKTDKENPRWFMVDVTFISRAKHFVPLALLRHLADSSSTEPPTELEYIGSTGLRSIKAMALVNRGRLSVQRVDEDIWEIIQNMAEKGGWEDMEYGKGQAKGKGKRSNDGDTQGKARKDGKESNEGDIKSTSTGRKRKAVNTEDDGSTRRSTRTRK